MGRAGRDAPRRVIFGVEGALEGCGALAGGGALALAEGCGAAGVRAARCFFPHPEIANIDKRPASAAYRTIELRLFCVIQQLSCRELRRRGVAPLIFTLSKDAELRFQR